MEGGQITRDLDVVILGASGFTGKYVVRELVDCILHPQTPQDAQIKVALAGRNITKLQKTLQWALADITTTTSAAADLQDRVSVLSADCTDPAALCALCQSTRVLVCCVGPFNTLGPPIVAACVAAGTHYVDISGESEFMERMELKFHDAAVQSRSLIVPSCASVSLLSDIGVLWHLRHWPLDWAPSAVQSYARLLSFPTYHAASAETAFQAFANARQLAQFRRTAPPRPKLKIPNQVLPPNGDKSLYYYTPLGHWTNPLPISDRSVVRRTFWTLHEHYPHGLPTLDPTALTPDERLAMWARVRPVHYKNYMCFSGFKWALAFKWAIHIITLIAPYMLGQNLLFKYPRIFTVGAFTKKGPSLEAIKRARFELWFIGHGHDPKEGRDTKIVTKMEGPEPCYVTSAIGVVQATYLCLHARHSLPIGGVLTTAAAFGSSNIIKRLESRGITFTHVKDTCFNPQNKIQQRQPLMNLFSKPLSWISTITLILFSMFLILFWP